MICQDCEGVGLVPNARDRSPLLVPCPRCNGYGHDHCCSGDDMPPPPAYGGEDD